MLFVDLRNIFLKVWSLTGDEAEFRQVAICVILLIEISKFRWKKKRKFF